MQTQWTDNRHIVIPRVNTFWEMWAKLECRHAQDTGHMLAPGMNGTREGQERARERKGEKERDREKRRLTECIGV